MTTLCSPQYYHENRCPRTLSLLWCQESGQIGNICLSQQVKTTNNHNNALAIQHFPPATLFSVKFCCDGKRDYGLRVKSTDELCTEQHTIYGKSAHCPLTLHSDTNADCLCCYSRRGIVLDLHAGAVGMGNRRGVVRCRRL